MDEQAVLELFRRQRHNFMNHLQVLYGYAQLNRLDAMGDYFNRLVQNLVQQSQLNRLADPRLALTLLRWSIVAEDEGVDLKIEASPMAGGMPLSDDKGLAEIDGFIQRAIQACQARPEEERSLHIRIDLVDGRLSIQT